MPRQRRIEYPGAIYHAMARGDRREDIVRDKKDRERFEETLAEVVEASGWVAQPLTMGARNARRFAQRTEKNVKSF